jgi:hypothetical protein
MKRLLCGFIIGLMISPYMSRTHAQDHPTHDLTAKDMVEIIADFDVKHVDQQPFYQPAFGVTNFDSIPPAIWLFTVGDTASRRSTVIHEMLHIRYRQLAIDAPEEFVREEEDRQYKKLFIEGIQ